MNCIICICFIESGLLPAWQTTAWILFQSIRIETYKNSFGYDPSVPSGHQIYDLSYRTLDITVGLDFILFLLIDKENSRASLRKDKFYKEEQRLNKEKLIKDKKFFYIKWLALHSVPLLTGRHTTQAVLSDDISSALNTFICSPRNLSACSGTSM